MSRRRQCGNVKKIVCLISSLSPGLGKIGVGPRDAYTDYRHPLDVDLVENQNKPVLEPGEFQILLGPSADPRGLLAACGATWLNIPSECVRLSSTQDEEGTSYGAIPFSFA